MKSSVEEIRKRFDNDVERFSDLESGQTSQMDSPLNLNLLESYVSFCHPKATSVLDIGCGAGNACLKVLQAVPGINCSLIDLSVPMLNRAEKRILAAGGKTGQIINDDIRNINLQDEAYDIVLSASALHHLRTKGEWIDTLKKIHSSLRTSGFFWYWDLVSHEDTDMQQFQTARYGEYLSGFRDEEYRDKVFAYIEEEDTPESVTFIMQALCETGFSKVDVMHKNGPYAALVARK